MRAWQRWCWEQHRGKVEALFALKDHERVCYAETASPTAAVEWFLAYREIETRLTTLGALTPLERRFLIVAFLPTLIFSTTMIGVTIPAKGAFASVAQRWDSTSGTIQVGLVLGFLTANLLFSAFVDSQTRNLTQIFEGYPIKHLAPKLADRAIGWHRERRDELVGVELIEDVDNGPDDAHGEATPSVNMDSTDADEPFAEELFASYSDNEDNILPTTFGNVIRAAEDYAQSRYSADYLLVWPRLAHVCSERFVMDYEAMRAQVNFLLVVAAYSGSFSVLSGVIVLYFAGPLSLFLLCVILSGLVAWLSYQTAVKAAIEFGEQMRASMDLFRLDLLEQLSFGRPSSATEEVAMWADFEGMLKRLHKRTLPYVHPSSFGPNGAPSPVDAGPPASVHGE